MQQIRSLLREKRTLLPALKMTLLTQSDNSRPALVALRKDHAVTVSPLSSEGHIYGHIANRLNRP
jgi:hypothetical protein